MKIAMKVLVLTILVTMLMSTCGEAKKRKNKKDNLRKFCKSKKGPVTSQGVTSSRNVTWTCRDLSTGSFVGVICNKACNLPPKCGRSAKRYTVQTQYFILPTIHKFTNNTVDIRLPIACNCVEKRGNKNSKRKSSKRKNRS